MARFWVVRLREIRRHPPAVVRHRSGRNCPYGYPKLTERQPREAAAVVSISRFSSARRGLRAHSNCRISPPISGGCFWLSFPRALFAVLDLCVSRCRRWQKWAFIEQIFALCTGTRTLSRSRSFFCRGWLLLPGSFAASLPCCLAALPALWNGSHPPSAYTHVYIYMWYVCIWMIYRLFPATRTSERASELSELNLCGVFRGTLCTLAGASAIHQRRPPQTPPLRPYQMQKQ